MSTTPVNKINDSLLLGGALEADGGIATGGLPVQSGALAGSLYAPGVFARALNGLITEHGAGFGFAAFEIEAALDTTGDTTTINLPAGALPAGAIVWGASVIVTTAIVVDSTDLEVQINGAQGGPPADVTVAALPTKAGSDPYAVGDSGVQNLFPPLSVAVADTITVLCSGGSTDTPASGEIRIAVTYYNSTPLQS